MRTPDELRKQIEKEHSVLNDIDIYIKLFHEDPENAKKEFPHISKLLNESLEEIEPHEIALLIRRTPELFPLWNRIVQESFGLNKIKHLKEYIFLCKSYLSINTNHPMIKAAISDKESLYIDALEHFNEILNNHNNNKGVSWEKVKNKEYILKALEDLSITKNKTCVLGPRKKSALLGFTIAMVNNGNIPDENLEKWIELIAKEIKMPLTSSLKHSDTSKKYETKTEEYIKNNH